MTVEGPPVSERNWACKHLTALTRTFPSFPPPGSFLDRSNGAHQPPSANVENVHGWPHETGVGAAESQGTAIEDCWSEGDGSDREEESPEGGGCEKAQNQFNQRYKIPCDNHGLSHLLQRRTAGSVPAGSSPGDPASAGPELLTLQQELDRDPEAHMLAASTRGCVVRRCLLRDGKGGVHLSNYGQARLEGNIFRDLNYAVRCIQNSTVNEMRVLLLLLLFECNG